MFGHLRIRLGLSQRDVPDTVSGLLRSADGSVKPVTGHPNDFPAFLVLPLFDKNPRLWLSPGLKHIPVHRFVSKMIFEPRAESAFRAPEVGMEHKFDVEAYQRMIAKIALGAAILKYDTGYFTPLVCDFIRGNETDVVVKYVFGYDSDQESPPFIEGHSIQLREHEHSGVTYVIRFVRLFAIYGAPNNGVIVGVVE